jgi:hypothetical protein
MKRALILVFAAILGFTSIVSANVSGIDLISQTHHVYGRAGWTDPDTYDYTDNVQVNGTVSGIGMDGYPGSASSYAGDFTVEAFAIGDYASRESLAESTYLFTPTNPVLTMTFTGEGTTSGGGFEANSEFSFYDITNDLEIDSHYWQGSAEVPFQYVIDWDEFYTVDPSHQYQLCIYAEAGFGSEGGYYQSLLNVSITTEPIANPAPSAIILGGIGVGFVTWLRKKKKLV